MNSQEQEVSSLPSAAGHNTSSSLDGAANALDYPSCDQPDWSSSEFSFNELAYESFLRWPVFRDVISETDQTIESFLLESGQDDGSGSLPSWAIHEHPAHLDNAPAADPENVDMARGVEEDDLVPLCKRFISIVNVRNPVLDGAELLSYAKAIAERGLRYDGPSCLVVSRFFSQYVAGHLAEIPSSLQAHWPVWLLRFRLSREPLTN